MKLLTLKLENFQGVKSADFDFGGHSAVIYGDNASGKTTVFNAFTWLLFGKNSLNRKDFEIKSLDGEGKVRPGLNHSVEATFDLNGKSLTIKKVYSENWVKKRGSAQREFTGHSIDHFIDGVPVKQGEYDNRIAGIVDEAVFKLLTSPTYFNEQLEWKYRRQLLLDVCGDIGDAEVIASDQRLSKLPDIIGDRTLTDHRKIIAARRSEINKELEKIPVRIDEVTNSLPKFIATDKPALENSIYEARKRLDALLSQEKITELGGGAAEVRIQLAELKAQQMELNNVLRAEADKIQEPLRAAKDKITSEIWSLEATNTLINSQILADQDRAGMFQEIVTELRKEWHQQNSTVFTYEDTTTCPTCGQSLPEEQVNQAREKALAAFNHEKAEWLERINKRGQEAKQELEKLTGGIALDEEALKNNREQAEQLKAELEALNNQLLDAPVVEDTDEQRALAAQQKLLEDKLAALQSDNQKSIDQIGEAINKERADLMVAEAELAKFEQHKSGTLRIASLKEQERQLAGEYEALEEELFLTEEFVRAKVKMLEEKINTRFKLARFKLFNVLVSGGIEECCETLFKGVPYNSLNGGARINVGLDIINTLSDYYNFSAPIFIDNKESVTELIAVNAQTIALVVSGQDKTLRVEPAEREDK